MMRARSSGGRESSAGRFGGDMFGTPSSRPGGSQSERTVRLAVPIVRENRAAIQGPEMRNPTRNAGGSGPKHAGESPSRQSGRPGQGQPFISPSSTPLSDLHRSLVFQPIAAMPSPPAKISGPPRDPTTPSAITSASALIQGLRRNAVVKSAIPSKRDNVTIARIRDDVQVPSPVRFPNVNVNKSLDGGSSMPGMTPIRVEGRPKQRMRSGSFGSGTPTRGRVGLAGDCPR